MNTHISFPVTTKLQLPQVTLVALTGIYYQPEAHQAAITKSCDGIDFGSVKVICDSRITDVDSWNKLIIYDLWKYVDTEYAFLFHADGYIIHPELWNPKWLEYDYCGSPWPLPGDDYSYRTPEGEVVRVGNSVGLRSFRMLRAPSLYNFEWKPYYGFTNEDGFLCVHNRKRLEELGMKFMPFEESLVFGKEHDIDENRGLQTFCFHLNA